MRRSDPPAIALIEIDSIARAMRVGDGMVKKAEVAVLQAHPVSTGKYVILIGGGEAEVDEAFRAGREIAADRVVDSLFLPGVHADCADAVRGVVQDQEPQDSIAVVECSTLAGAILACDAAAKEAPVAVVGMRLGQGIGGKGVFKLSGELSDIQASIEAAQRSIESRGVLIAVEVVPRPDERFAGSFAESE